MGIWNSLTVQGRLALLALAAAFLFLVGVLYNGSGSSGSPGLAGFVTFTPTRSLEAVAETPTPGPPAAGVDEPGAAQQPTQPPEDEPAGEPTPNSEAIIEEAATPTPVEDEPEPEPTPVEELPTSTPPPPPPTEPPPEPTPIGCTVTASVTPSSPPGNDTVTASLICGGEPVSNAEMTGQFNYSSGLGIGCSGGSGATVSCSANRDDPDIGHLIGARACFEHDTGRHCANAAGIP